MPDPKKQTKLTESEIIISNVFQDKYTTLTQYACFAPISVHPTNRVVSDVNSCLGTSRLAGAGPFIMRPEAS